jgi:outer membrane protein assembly factor BamB
VVNDDIIDFKDMQIFLEFWLDSMIDSSTRARHSVVAGGGWGSAYKKTVSISLDYAFPIAETACVVGRRIVASSQCFFCDRRHEIMRGGLMHFHKQHLKWLLIIIVSHTAVMGDEWPQWRGPKRDARWQEEGLIQKFEQTKIPVLWRAPLSRGYSGVTVAENLVYTMDRIKEPEQVERILCFDARTGKAIWSHGYKCQYKIAYPAGPRASVTIDNKHAYALGAMGDLHCLDAVNGKVIWSKDLNAEYEIKVPTWGIACSPLVEKELVIVQVAGKKGASVVAFDKNTGREKWRALDDPVNYSSPIVIDQGGKRVVISWTANRLAGIDAVTGQVLWQQPFSATVGIATPVQYKNYLFVSSFFDGSLLLKLKDKEFGSNVVWQRKGKSEMETDSLHCCISTPVICDNYIYGVDSYGELRCLDLLTGDRVWENLSAVPHNRWANIFMVQNGDYTWMFNECGELIISKLRPDGFHEISRVKIIKPTGEELGQRGGVCWAHPAFASGNIYVRNDEELICLNLSAKNNDGIK